MQIIMLKLINNIHNAAGNNQIQLYIFDKIVTTLIQKLCIISNARCHKPEMKDALQTLSLLTLFVHQKRSGINPERRVWVYMHNKRIW